MTTHRTSLTSMQTDRAVGAIVASAAADALGAPYEFHPPLADGVPVRLHAGGGWDLGEWTDDTSMAIPILEELAAGASLDDPETLHRIGRQWRTWAGTAKDVGIQIRRVLSTAPGASESELRATAEQVHRSTGRSAGNGSLMRTGPVALGLLHADDATLAAAARRLSDLTHFEDDAGDACVLWSLAIRHAILEGAFDVRSGITALPEERRTLWSERFDVAERTAHPKDIPGSNGWVVAAIQAAWCALTHSTTLQEAIELAVRSGNDTDTVAAITGSLAGARWGRSAVPAAWLRHLHGWPGQTVDDLVRSAVLATRRGVAGENGWPAAARWPVSGLPATLVVHPHDDGVLLGDLTALDTLAEDGTGPRVDAVVSLCRVGREQVPAFIGERTAVWLVDQDGSNADPAGVLADAADSVAAYRAEGLTVLVHCFEGRSRTPSVGAAYSVRHLGIPADQALQEVSAVLPRARPARFLVDAVHAVRPAEVEIDG
ncbi:ADP-ribosylglycohydrolase family protein [Rathayibacter sp. AY1H3]|uniref:ADP-ribosylglycohydrolase family protein n=1 Tax=Rathayibacter sp. AY1H3 TaxID=2080567 RepID=UPI000CE91D47|nr:ADP-ribosylglycohydrolase family protein [Rathayibacter sp. AY1H3]PPH07608.1 ribosylglycohydrolase [Rathayibacter sp. AY1H3]